MRSKGRPFPELFCWRFEFPAGCLGEGSRRKCRVGHVVGGGPCECRRHVGFAPAQGPGAPWGAGGLRARARPRPPQPDPGEEAALPKKPGHGQGQGPQVGSGGVPEAAEAGPPAGEPEVHEEEASGRGPEDHHEDPSPKPRQESQGPTSHQAEEGETPGHSVHRGRLPQVPGGIFWEFWDQVTEGGAPSLNGRPHGTSLLFWNRTVLGPVGPRDVQRHGGAGSPPPHSQLWEPGFLPIPHPASLAPACGLLFETQPPGGAPWAQPEDGEGVSPGG